MAILTGWRLKGRNLSILAISTSFLTVVMAAIAWIETLHGAQGFWKNLHETYWPLYVVFGSLLVVFGAYLSRENMVRVSHSGYQSRVKMGICIKRSSDA